MGKNKGNKKVMHISEGILSPSVLAVGFAVSATGTAIGLKKMKIEKISQVAVISSAFFVASLIHIPIGPANAHLIMNGLMGILLGWMAFPAILVVLMLQALVFQYGGFTVLGVNTFIMAAPAISTYYLFRYMVINGRQIAVALAGFLTGTTGVGLAALLLAIALVSTGEEFTDVAKLVILAHLPIFIIEGAITSFCVLFLKKVKPEILQKVS